MGEIQQRIYIVGNPALDRFIATPPIGKQSILKSLGKPEWESYALVIYHPILGEEDDAAQYFEQVMTAINGSGIPAVVNYPNVDAGSREIIAAMEKWKENDNFVFFRNLPSEQFTNLMRHASVMIGNSSAGLLEAPIIPLATVNVGSRQRGRLAAKNVIFVEQNEPAIRQGITRALSDDFQKQLQSVVSPYGQGDSVAKILTALRSLPTEKLLNKSEDPLS